MSRRAILRKKVRVTPRSPPSLCPPVASFSPRQTVAFSSATDVVKRDRKKGVETGILKTPTVLENAIEQRLAAQHCLLLDMAPKMKGLIAAVAKLLVRNEDITALEGIIASNESLQQSLPFMLSQTIAEHDHRIAGGFARCIDVQNGQPALLRTNASYRPPSYCTACTARTRSFNHGARG